MEPFLLFFAHSFAKDKLNHHGETDPNGITDSEIAERLVGWVHELSRGRIEIIETRDPFDDYVSSRIRRDICRADGVLCLFTKRTKDHLKGLWIPSTYVISEASAALMQFPSEQESHRRLFGLLEEGVDAEQLGMAFHGNKTASRFRRDDLGQLHIQVGRIVDAILDERGSVPKRNGRQYVSMDKVVSIWRTGAVWVETRHRFRFTKEVSTVRIPHRIWRVRSELPELSELLHGTRGSEVGFLRVMPLYCGRHDPEQCKCAIKPGRRTRWGYERDFVVEFPNIDLSPGEELTYEIVWGYPNAFHNPEDITAMEGKPNSVGLRTGERGSVESVSLTLRFERDWEGEPYRTLEGPLRIFTTETTDLPGAHSPEEFFHNSESWKLLAEMRPCSKRSCTMAEVYHWTAAPFRGMAKATFIPHLSYFDNTDAVMQVITDEGERPAGQSS